MLNEINQYLADHVSLERRALVVDCLRTLEAVLGAGIYEPLDPLLTIEEAQEPASTLDTINETILGLFYQAYAQFGISLNKDLLEADQFQELSNGIEALLQLEVSEYGEELSLALECSDDTVEALLNSMETVLPGTEHKLSQIIENVSVNLIQRIRETLHSPTIVTDFDDQVTAAYLSRIKTYNSKFRRPELVEFLLDSGANLRLNPEHSIGLVAEHFVEYEIREVAETIYALVVYSSVPDDQVVSLTKKLCEQAFADENKIAQLELVINEVFRS